jgi:hypothetical protein
MCPDSAAIKFGFPEIDDAFQFFVAIAIFLYIVVII